MASNSTQYTGQVNLPNDGQVTTVYGLDPNDPEYAQTQSRNTSPAIIPSVPSPSTNNINATATNPNSRGVNDVSDIRPTSTIINLPTRAEKRLIPTKVDASTIEQTFVLDEKGSANPNKTQKQVVKDTDFYIYANTEAKRLQNAVDFIKIRIPHRGVSATGSQPDSTQAVEYRFLVNPSTLTVNRQTVDAQSMTRGGWQFGVWGEDCFMVQMQGASAGFYFSLGTTDEFSYYAVSYRNLMQLQEVFENNGYWFEGEEYNEGPLAADYLRRRIRMHQDVELWCGNFIWFGMFDSFSISQDAEHPFILNFNLSFFVWKERYRSTSPYWGSIQNNVQRGHSYEAIEKSVNTIQNNNTLSQYAPSAVEYQNAQLNSSANTNGTQVQSPAVLSANASDQLTTISPTISGQIGTQPLNLLTLPNNPINSDIWTGVMNPKIATQVLDITG